MKILIIGGSGILSTDFTKLCLDRNNEVYILNRGRRKAFIDERANLVVADIRNESVELLKEKLAIHKYDVVVDFLTYTPEQMKKTLSIIEGRFTQYIFISSATAYIKDDANQLITEQNKIGNADWDYAFQKSCCENYLSQQDVNYTIIRPYVTFGVSRIPFPIIPDGYNYTLLERIKENKPVVMLDGGNNICTLTNTKDFAEVLYRLLLNENAYREDFHITSSNRQSWKEVYLTLCKVLGKKANICSVNIDDIHKYMPEFEAVLKGDKGQNMLFDNRKVLNAVGGYKFKYDLYDSIKDSVAYFENAQEMQRIDFKFDGRCDFLIYVKFHQKHTRVKNNNLESNNVVWYYIMSNPVLRFIYEKARLIKNVFHKFIGR